ncbi:MAG: tRNA lysidine(34) synthetase TilS [Alphaproteobacteria bacterium]|nr:tRNA lysidine(34) synthetase TilS [Alphaproteobacteria bacterium]
MSLTSEQFNDLMGRPFGGAFEHVQTIAVGVSGGGDSMALLWLLQEWCAVHDKILHVLSVDHGLRKAARGECESVADYCAAFEHVQHHILTWEAPKNVRVQEGARKARYALMRGYCFERGIQHLFLAHHQGDQAETVLFRLAKGSGLDGLAGMRMVQEMDGLLLCRPLLHVPKDDLVAVCDAQGIEYVDDPSNVDDGYARVRLRQSMDILSAEGLSEKRLSVIAMRMARARDALDDITQKAFADHLLFKNTNRIEFKISICDAHDEIVLRLLLMCISDIGLDRDYAPRMEKVEDLMFSLKHDVSFRKRTLGGVIFERDDVNKRLILACEKSE